MNSPETARISPDVAMAQILFDTLINDSATVASVRCRYEEAVHGRIDHQKEYQRQAEALLDGTPYAALCRQEEAIEALQVALGEYLIYRSCRTFGDLRVKLRHHIGWISDAANTPDDVKDWTLGLVRSILPLIEDELVYVDPPRLKMQEDAQ